MKRALILAIFAIALALPLFAQEMSPQQKEVWQMEETYWRDVKGFDEAHYLTLWHEEFLGWPRDQKMPIGKMALREAVHPKFQRQHVGCGLMAQVRFAKQHTCEEGAKRCGQKDRHGDPGSQAGQTREMSASCSDRIVSTLPGSPWRAQRPCS